MALVPKGDPCGFGGEGAAASPDFDFSAIRGDDVMG